MKTADYVIFNSKLAERETLCAGLQNRAFRYGDGLFESIKMIDGRPLFTDLHIGRLLNGMRILKMYFPRNFTPDFRELCMTLAEANGIKAGAYIRLTVFRKDGGKFRPDTNEADFIMEIFPEKNIFELSKDKIIAVVYRDLKKQIGILNSVKSNNALLFVLASVYAAQNNFDEAFILNERDMIIEATSSNLFAVQGDTLITPDLASGPLPGIMRRNVMEISRDIGFELVERALTEEDLLSADEVFLTNALAGLKAVGGFGPKRYFKRVSLKIVNALNELTKTI